MPEKKKNLSCAECDMDFMTQEELDGHNESAHEQTQTAGKNPKQAQKKQPERKTA